MAGRILIILGAKSGGGTTVIAANLALSLSKETRKKVALIDLDIQGRNDFSQILDITSQKTIADLIPIINKLDVRLIKGYLTFHRSGVSLLPFTLTSAQIKDITPEQVKNILKMLQGAYDYIVIDGQSLFTHFLIASLELTDALFLILLPDILSIHQARKKLEMLGGLKFPLREINLILNRNDLKGAMKLKEVESSLNKEIDFTIPNDELVISSLNSGRPMVLHQPRSSFTQSILKITLEVDKVKGEPAPEISLAKEKVSLPEEEQIQKEIEEISPEVIKKKAKEDEIIVLKQRVHKKLIDKLDLKKIGLTMGSDASRNKELRQQVEETVNIILSEEKELHLTKMEYKGLIKEIVDEALGLGPLEELLADRSITEIMVNKKDQIYFERGGRLYLSDKNFISNQQIIDVIRRIIAPLGRRIDESVPMVDARLKDGSRVNAIIPPLAVQGPMITIRRFSEKMFTVDDLIKFGTLNQEMAEFLRACVLGKKSMVISGGTGSGKTTLLNVLSSFIPHDERIITIEDTAELRLAQEHVGTLEARPPNIEGKGAVTIRQLVRNVLRMRPDRIVVGECRGGETLDMLQAMNTGHEGSLTTVHANSSRDLLTRLETMTLMADIELPIRVIREQIASAIDLIVQITRLTDGSRKIIQITEITGREGDVITMQDIFIFKQTGVGKEGKIIGIHQPTGFIPKFVEEFKVREIPLNINIFREKKK